MKLFQYVLISILVGIIWDFSGFNIPVITESYIYIYGIFGLLLYIAVQIGKKKE
ncbi:hypothetical protein SAMN05877753_103234 [Bacillus oleivorans]|uniref:Uncharacterized protein n=1 Tax=Bacillus oleivorans TaxID=1448271 RepID=A0A285CQF9_9BACI|nr:hypothetical protein SAMN05877753_103234 [Bacillus oleivorans]